MVRSADVILCLVCVLFPPAAAAIVTGCSCDLLINILLTVLGYIPGHIHGFYIIYKQAQAEERYGKGNFVYRGNGEYEPLDLPSNQQPVHYGTTYGSA
ncbi:hypothetical protein JCM8547_001474 [Rhodosporidiobolus lusitaniae]